MPNSLELNVSPAQLHTFANHPFHVRKDIFHVRRRTDPI